MSGQITLNKQNGGQLTLEPENNAVNKTISIPDHGFGKVLQVKTDVSTTEIDHSSDAWIDMGLSVSITPSSSTNYFLVIIEGHFSSQNSTDAKGYGFNIYKDGTAVTTSPRDSSVRPFDFYQDGGARFFKRDTKTYYATTGTTSEVTFTGKFKSYNGTITGVTLGFDGETQHTLTVMEVAG